MSARGRPATQRGAADERLRHELTVARNRLGNAIGAIIDSGGYCTGPEDVAAAIGRLTAERDAERALADRLGRALELTPCPWGPSCKEQDIPCPMHPAARECDRYPALDEWRRHRGA